MGEGGGLNAGGIGARRRDGIRIGEGLGLRLNDLDIRGRKIHLEKNSMGRVVYLRCAYV